MKPKRDERTSLFDIFISIEIDRASPVKTEAPAGLAPPVGWLTAVQLLGRGILCLRCQSQQHLTIVCTSECRYAQEGGQRFPPPVFPCDAARAAAKGDFVLQDAHVVLHTRWKVTVIRSGRAGD